MSPFVTHKNLLAQFCCGILLVTGVEAAVSIATDSGGTYTASTTDLLQTQVASVDKVGSQTGEVTFLTDGSIGGTDTNAWRANADDAVTYTLDISTNTLGYDITNITTYAQWTSRSNQGYTVSVSLVGSADFTTLATVSEEFPGGPFTQVIVTDDSGVLATGVDAIRFEAADLGLNWNGYREFDVSGAATIPEPSVALVSGLGCLLLLRRRRIQ